VKVPDLLLEATLVVFQTSNDGCWSQSHTVSPITARRRVLRCSAQRCQTWRTGESRSMNTASAAESFSLTMSSQERSLSDMPGAITSRSITYLMTLMIWNTPVCDISVVTSIPEFWSSIWANVVYAFPSFHSVYRSTAVLPMTLVAKDRGVDYGKQSRASLHRISLGSF
jgi:hypothetical protein